MGAECSCEVPQACDTRECTFEKFSEQTICGSLRAAVAAMQGWRPTMEDQHHFSHKIGPNADCSLFCVFDGHGGGFAAKWVSKQLAVNISAALDGASHLHQSSTAIDGVNLTEQHNLGQDPVATPEQLCLLLRQATLETDEQLRAEMKFFDRSGCTVVMALITPTHVIVGNLGDSRAVLGTGRQTVAMSQDHKPGLEGERERIYNANSVVVSGRVDRDLNLSRSLGDFRFKTFQPDNYNPSLQAVSPDPDFVVRLRCPAQDEFLILACDGIWDVMSNDDAVKFCRDGLLAAASPIQITESLIEKCLQLGSTDNMTAMVVLFPGARVRVRQGDMLA